MKKVTLIARFWNDQSGAVISAELIMILTLVIGAVAVGWSKVSGALVGELNDLGNAIGAIDQSYHVPGYEHQNNGACDTASNSGFGFADREDPEVCDCAAVTVRTWQNIKQVRTGNTSEAGY